MPRNVKTLMELAERQKWRKRLGKAGTEGRRDVGSKGASQRDGAGSWYPRHELTCSLGTWQ